MPTRLHLPAVLVLLAAVAAALPPAAAASTPSGTTSLTTWLAGQIGPVHRPAGAPARAVHMRSAGAGAATLSVAGPAHPLRLVRSYLIPAGDPSAARLANWSWTYDSAVTAIAFTDAGDRAHAAVLLDQLAALQGADGSIATAFDVQTGESSAVVRAGTVAWVGLAAAAYDHRFGSSRYAAVAGRAAAALLALRSSDGLVRGGADVTWISTQNNLLAYALLARLGRDLSAAHTATAARDAAAATAIAAGITSGLVSTAGGTHLIEGVGDTVLPLDVQSLGAMFLRSRGQTGLARQVVAFANTRFAVSGRSVVRSAAPATYNETYSAPGPFTGYRPFAGSGTPDVLWFEGTAQMRAAAAAVGESTHALDASIRSWERITSHTGDAPLMADRTVDAGGYGEYHVWPAAAGAAWAVLAADGPGLFPAPARG